MFIMGVLSMDRQKSSVSWLKLIVALVALMTCCEGSGVAFAQATDDGADSLLTSTNNTITDLSTNDGNGGGGGSTGNNSNGSRNQNNEPGGSGNNNQGNNNNPPPCVPPPQGLFGGVANIIGIVLNPCK